MVAATSTPPVIDAWVNIFPESFASRWTAKEEQQGVVQLFGPDLAKGHTVQTLLEAMDGAGIQTGVLTAGLSDPARAHRRGGFAAEDFLAIAEEHPGRFLVSVTVDRVAKPLDNVRRLRELAQHPATVLARVTPLVEQYDLNHRLYYPVYATAAELGIPMSINVGIPGPQVRSRCQDPVHLEDVLIDFPTLTVIGAHMGHPYEALLIQYMLKWPQLHLMTSAYLATYMDPAMVKFMDSSRGRGRILFASDHPVIPAQKALDAARALPLSDEGMALYLGGAAQRIFGLM
ncbi:amidohydrolase family protein [Aquihabitans sp. McL0605]|uniref:amidohydrolase family protein n=1 Tax=Aquihabitans sp. McL0605 TaxID=3415671 RepID=UPI003CEF8489